MKALQKTVLAFLAVWLVLTTSVSASEFLRLCRASVGKAESFLAECRLNARPFKRSFVRGSGGSTSLDEYAAWFDITNIDSNFGLGCILGPQNEVRFLGLYFVLKSQNFHRANLAPFSFIDLQGNVGLQSPNGTTFTLLAVHKLLPSISGHTSETRECDIGSFDRDLAQTIRKRGDWFELYKLESDNPTTITRCIDREVKYEKNQCFSQTYKSFLNETNSPVIYSSHSIVITEEGRLYIENNIMKMICEDKLRSPLEFVNFVNEVCSDRR